MSIIKTTLKDTSEVKITVTAESESWQKNQKIAFEELRKKMKIDDTKKKNISFEKAKSLIKPKDILLKAVDLELEKLQQIAKQSLGNEEIPIFVPNHEIKSMNKETLTIMFTFPIFPQIKLPDYKNMDVSFKTNKKANSEMDLAKERYNFQRLILNKIKEKCKVKVSNLILEKEAENEKIFWESQLKAQNINIEKWMAENNFDDAKLNGYLKEIAYERTVDSLIFTEIARLEKIETNETDYEKHYQKLASIHNVEISEIKKSIPLDKLQIFIIHDKVLDLLIKSHS